MPSRAAGLPRATIPVTPARLINTPSHCHAPGRPVPVTTAINRIQTGVVALIRPTLTASVLNAPR